MAKSCMMEGWLAHEIASSRETACWMELKVPIGVQYWALGGGKERGQEKQFFVILSRGRVWPGCCYYQHYGGGGDDHFCNYGGDHHFCDFGGDACHSGMMGDMARGCTVGGGCRGVLIDGSRVHACVHAADAARRHDDMACGNISQVGHPSTRLSSL